MANVGFLFLNLLVPLQSDYWGEGLRLPVSVV